MADVLCFKRVGALLDLKPETLHGQVEDIEDEFATQRGTARTSACGIYSKPLDL